MYRKHSAVKKLAAGLLVGTAATGSLLWLTFGNKVPFQVPAYRVESVYDGDTFITTEKQKVRLAGIDAPELENCGGQEAKQELTRLVLSKPIYIKVLYKDPFFRLVSLVYNQEGFVNQIMLERGFAYYYTREKGTEILKPFSEVVRQKKIGIFAPECTQLINLKQPSCIIKGNNRQGSSKTINYYFLPTCKQYKIVDVQLYLGDQWFCSESEAQKAGYTLAPSCK